MLYRGRGGGRDRPTRHAKVGGLGKHQDRTAKLRSLPTAGELGRIIERGSEKLVHLALCLRRGHVLGWAKRPLPPAVHHYFYGPFKPVDCRLRGLAFGGDEDISAKHSTFSRESALGRV